MGTVHTPYIGSDIVTVTRTIKNALYSEPQVHGPMPYATARRLGHLSTSSGTVLVTIDCDDPAWHARHERNQLRADEAWHRKRCIR